MFRLSFPRVVPLAFFVFVALSCLPATASSQEAMGDPDSRQAVLTLLDEMGAVETVVTGIKSGIPMAKASSPELPEEFWDKFTTAILSEVDGLVEALAPLYLERFSLEEIRALTEFYRSPVGQRLVEEQPSMLAESHRIGAAWGERVALQVAQKMMGPEPND